MGSNIELMMGALGALSMFVFLTMGYIMKRAGKLLDLIPDMERLKEVNLKFDTAIEKLNNLLSEMKLNGFKMDGFDASIKKLEEKQKILENRLMELEKICMKNHLGG